MNELRAELSQLSSSNSIRGVDPLEIPIEWMRFCPRCNSDQRFVANRIFYAGLIGKCVNCGEERIAPFTRTTAKNADHWESLT